MKKVNLTTKEGAEKEHLFDDPEADHVSRKFHEAKADDTLKTGTFRKQDGHILHLDFGSICSLEVSDEVSENAQKLTHTYASGGAPKKDYKPR